MTDFTNIVIVLSIDDVNFDDKTLFVAGIIHVTCII